MNRRGAPVRIKASRLTLSPQWWRTSGGVAAIADSLGGLGLFGWRRKRKARAGMAACNLSAESAFPAFPQRQSRDLMLGKTEAFCG
jgi:hypothetical protein